VTGEKYVSSAATIIPDLATLPLESSQPVIYDHPIGIRLLYQDPMSGAEHYLVRYPPGMSALRHRHSAAHTIVVLEGKPIANGVRIGPGGYCTFSPDNRCTMPPREGTHACSSPSSTGRSTSIPSNSSTAETNGDYGTRAP
jgi:hypothetical protein